MNITGQTKLLALIGDPVVKARTPALMNHLLHAQGMQDDYTLIPMQVSRIELAEVINSLRCIENFSGAVITMPHKVAVCALLDSITPEAQAIGAVNVIHRDTQGKLHGHILDGEGFVSGLLTAGYQVQGRHCMIRGAGGAAAAIAFALARHGCGSLRIYNRTIQTAESLKDRLNVLYPDFKVTVGDSKAFIAENSTKEKNTLAEDFFDIAINASSLGMNAQDSLPFSLEIIKCCKLVAECVIAPEQTAFLQLSKSLSIETHAGINMLNSQLALMLQFMTKKRAK